MAGKLLDRDREIAAIGRAVAAGAAGHGAVVVIEAPPGSGKSRLCAEAARLGAEAGLTVRSARGTEMQSSVPFGVVEQLLGVPVRAPGGAPGDPLPDRGPALVEAFAHELDRRMFGTDGRGNSDGDAAPQLLVVDDEQWIDKASATFLSHLAVRIEGMPVALIVASRPGRHEGRPLLRELLAVPGAELVEPLPLGTEAIAALTSEALGDRAHADLVQAVGRASGGNPFYVTELLRELDASTGELAAPAIAELAPPGVLRAVTGRLDGLGPQARALADAVAILDGAPLEQAAELAEIPLDQAGEAADALAEAGLLGSAEPLQLSHPLIATALRAEMGSFARSRAHATAASILAEAGASDELVASQLLHARPAGDARIAARLREAGRVAGHRGEPELAARFFARALAEGAGESEPGERAATLVELADVEVRIGSADAEQHLAQALDGLTDPAERARAAVALARTLHHAGNFIAAAEIVELQRHELATAASTGNGDGTGNGNGAQAEAERLEAELLGAWISSAILSPPLRERLAETMAPLFQQAAAGELPADPTVCALLAPFMSSTDADPALVRRVALAAFEHDPLVNGDSRGAALGYAAYALIEVDALQELTPLLDAAELAAQERGASIALSIARHMRAIARFHAGDLEGAITDAELSLEVHRFGWEPSPWSTPILALAHLARGDLDAAAEAIATGERAPGQRSDDMLLLEARAALRLAQGRPEEALADARAAGEITDGQFGVKSSRIFDWTRLGALAAHEADRPEEAAELTAEAVARGRHGQVARSLGRALTTAGVITGGEAGEELLTEAVAELSSSPSRLHYAAALLELGAARRRRGKRTAAEGPLFEALELADGFGAVPLIERARSELNALGRRPRRAARTGVGALTPSERRVAELAAAGLSTPDIAHRLYVTRKTVESHLGQTYRKLEISGRRELARVLEPDASPATAGDSGQPAGAQGPNG